MNILVAEDDTAIRKMIANFLREAGYNVFEAADGIQTFSSIINLDINIAILDWVLPGMDGIQVCRQIRDKHHTSYVFIIMLTVKSDHEDLMKGFDAGVDEYLTKPVNLLELNARIKVGARVCQLEQRLKEKQKELADINMLKNKFIGIVAHDLRNPIISIRGFSELLLKDPSAFNDEQNEFLNIIHSTSRTMMAMLNDLLDISLIESGKLEISKKLGSFKQLILDRIQQNILQAQKKAHHTT